MRFQRASWIISIMLIVISAVLGGLSREHYVPRQDLHTFYTPELGLHINLPSVNDVKSITIDLNAPVENRVTTIRNTPDNRPIIQNVLAWLSQSKGLGYEGVHPFISIGPTMMTIYTKGSREIQVMPTFNPIHINDGHRTA